MRHNTIMDCFRLAREKQFPAEAIEGRVPHIPELRRCVFALNILFLLPFNLFQTGG